MHRFFFAPAALALAFVLPACADGDSEFAPGDDVTWQDGEAPQEVVTSGRSGLSPTCFWNDSTQMTLRLYGKQSLEENGALRPPHALSDSCAEVVDYVVRCALPQGTIVKTAAGKAYEGQFGLAPNWVDAPLSSSEQRWVTACLLQHVSSVDDVPIALAGANPAFGGSEQAFQGESIVSGNLFTGGTAPIGEPAFEAYGCADTGLVDACGADAEVALYERMCGKSAKCGLKMLGSCADQCEFDGNGKVIGCFGDVSRELVRMRVDSAAMTALHGDVCQ